MLIAPLQKPSVKALVSNVSEFCFCSHLSFQTRCTGFSLPKFIPASLKYALAESLLYYPEKFGFCQAPRVGSQILDLTVRKSAHFGEHFTNSAGCCRSLSDEMLLNEK